MKCGWNNVYLGQSICKCTCMWMYVKERKPSYISYYISKILKKLNVKYDKCDELNMICTHMHKYMGFITYAKKCKLW